MGRTGVATSPHAKAGRLPFSLVSHHKKIWRIILTEGKQMSAATLACAPSGVSWPGINWAIVQRQVRRLQTRIVKATQEGRHNRAKALQWLLTHSYSGKVLAVKRVTGNKGKNISMQENKVWNRVSLDAFERLEPCALKGASTVLRGLGTGNRARLPDTRGYCKQIGRAHV